MLALYSHFGFSAYAKYGRIQKKVNPFFRHDIETKEIDLIKFSGVRNLSEDFIKRGLLPIGRLACFSGDELLSAVRYGQSIKYIDSQGGKVLVCLRKQGRMPFYTDNIPNFTFIVCDRLSVGSKSGDNCRNLGGDDTCFTLHNFKLLDFPQEPIGENQTQIINNLYGENAQIKQEDLILNCYDAHGGCIVFRIESYAFGYADGRGNSGQTLPKITNVYIEEDNTLVLTDGSSDWTMHYGVRLVHSRTRDEYEWRRTFASLYSAYYYLMELNMERFRDNGIWKSVWVWGGQTKTITHSEVIDNR